MVRCLTIAISAAWLFATSLQAPFRHFHPHDPDHHHATGFAHLHLGVVQHEQHHSGSASLPEIDAHDDGEAAIWQEWTATDSPRVNLVHAEVAVALSWVPRFVPTGVAPQLIVRSHDPPGQRLLPARAPPL